MARVVHFEVPATEPERAAKFYETVFDWKIQKWDGPVEYWLCDTGEDLPGINGGITRANPMMPCITNTLGVSSVDEYTKKITDAGGSVVAPKMAIPGVGYLAYCKDSEGNVFGIMQSDGNAG